MYETIKPHCSGKILEIGSGVGNISSFFINDGFDIFLTDIRDNYCDILKDKYSTRKNLIGVQNVDLIDLNLEWSFNDSILLDEFNENFKKFGSPEDESSKAKFSKNDSFRELNDIINVYTRKKLPYLYNLEYENICEIDTDDIMEIYSNNVDIPEWLLLKFLLQINHHKYYPSKVKKYFSIV